MLHISGKRVDGGLAASKSALMTQSSQAHTIGPGALQEAGPRHGDGTLAASH